MAPVMALAEVQLQITEKLNKAEPPSIRKRVVSVSADSVTIGTHSHSDVQLNALEKPLQIEIKYTDLSWWVVNLDREPGVLVNQIPIIFEYELRQNDEIEIQGHRIVFKIRADLAQRGPDFKFKAASDLELWNFLLQEAEFDEVMINGAKNIFVDWRGMLFKSPFEFSSNEFLAAQIEAHTQKKEGWISWRLHRTLRIQAALPPITEVPHLAIRKAKQKVLSIEELERTQFGTPDEIDFLRKALAEKQNIIISGGTSTGKTVLLRSLIEKINPEDRLVVVEEEAETDWPHPHLVAIESGRGNLRSTVIECLRMRPTRLMISEVRGAEAFELLQAMNTGHEGSMTTIHSNSPRDALSRLENLVLTAGVPLTVLAVRRQLAQAIHLIVQLERKSNGRRQISQIVRVSGIQNDIILLSDPVGVEAKGLKQEWLKDKA